MNNSGALSLVIAVIWLALIAALMVRLRKRRGHIGPAATGAIYDLLNEDKRKAVEVIVEERAGARDAEDRDGNLPELEDPKRKPI